MSWINRIIGGSGTISGIADVPGLVSALDAKASTALASASTDGLMPKTDKSKVDGILVTGAPVLLYSYDQYMADAAPLNGATLNNPDTIYFKLENGELYDTVTIRPANGDAGPLTYSGSSRFSTTPPHYFLMGASFMGSDDYIYIVRATKFGDSVPVYATVTFTVVRTPIPIIAVPLFNPYPLTFAVKQGLNLPSMKLTISMDDDSAQTVGLVDDNAVLSFAPITGATPYDTVVTFDLSALTAGTYQNTITATPTDGDIGTLVSSYTITSDFSTAYLGVSDSIALDNVSLLQDYNLTGSKAIFAFPLPASGITDAVWKIDGNIQVTRTAAPFDLGAAAGGTAAVLFDSTVLSNGVHTVSCDVSLPGMVNLNTFSRNFNDASYTKNLVSQATTAPIVGPGGANDLYKLQATTAASVQRTLSKSITISGTPAQYTFVCIAKKSQCAWAKLILSHPNGDNTSAFFNVDTAQTINNISTLGFTGVSQSIVDLGNGIYKCILTATSVAGQTSLEYNFLMSFSGDASPALTVGQGIYLYSIDIRPGNNTDHVYTGSTVVNQAETTVSASATINVNNTVKRLFAPNGETSLSFSGSNPDAQVLALRSEGGDTTFSVNLPTWVLLDTGGTITGSADFNISIDIDTAGFTAGELNTGSIVFTPDNGGTPLSISVSAIVPISGANLVLWASKADNIAYRPNNTRLSPTDTVKFWIAPADNSAAIPTVGVGENVKFYLDATNPPDETGATLIKRRENPELATAQDTGTNVNFPTTVGQHNVIARWYYPSAPLLREAAIITRGSVSQHKKFTNGILLRLGNTTTPLTGLALTVAKHPVVDGIRFKLKMGQVMATNPGTPAAMTDAHMDYTVIDACIAYAKSLGKKVFFLNAEKYGGFEANHWFVTAGYTIDGTQNDGSRQLNWSNTTATAYARKYFKLIAARYDNDPTFMGICTSEMFLNGVQMGPLYPSIRQNSLDFINDVGPDYHKSFFLFGMNSYISTPEIEAAMIAKGIGTTIADVGPWSSVADRTEDVWAREHQRIWPVMAHSDMQFNSKDFIKNDATWTATDQYRSYVDGLYWPNNSKVGATNNGNKYTIACINHVWSLSPSRPNWGTQTIALLDAIQAGTVAKPFPADQLPAIGNKS